MDLTAPMAIAVAVLGLTRDMTKGEAKASHTGVRMTMPAIPRTSVDGRKEDPIVRMGTPDRLTGHKLLDFRDRARAGARPIAPI